MGLPPGHPPRPAATAIAAPRAPRRDALRITLFILILLDVSRLHQHWQFLAVLRPMQVLVGAVFIYAYLNPKLLCDVRLWSTAWPARVVMALGVVACLSMIFGISFGGSARFILEDYLKTLVMTFLLMSTIRNARDLAFYAWAYVAACGLLVWMSLFVFGVSKGSEGIYRLQNLYTYDGNDVCVVLLIGLGLCLFTFQTSGRLGKLATAVIALGIGDVLARTGSRGGFVGLVAFAAAFLVLPAKASIVKRVVAIGAVAIALQIGSPQGYWEQMQTMLSPKEDYNWTSATGRRQVAKRGIGYMKRYPLFGVGINNFPRAEGTLSQRAKDWRPSDPGIRWIAPHNSFIQVGAEMGLPALVLWSSLLIGGVRTSWRLRRRIRARWPRRDEEQTLLYRFTESLPLSLIAFGVSATFVSFAYLSPVYILGAYVTGMVVAFRDRQRRDTAGGIVARAAGQREALAASSRTR